MSFEDRLHKAIERGKRRSDAKRSEAEARALTEEELKRLHSTYRLQLSEHIESCVRQLPNFFPGFRLETIFGERGWGAACSRDDLRVSGGRRQSNDYSRLELTVRPASRCMCLIWPRKGRSATKKSSTATTSRNSKTSISTSSSRLIDLWVLEYAELYAAKA